MGNEKELLALANNLYGHSLVSDIISTVPGDDPSSCLHISTEQSERKPDPFTPYTPTDEEIRPLLGDKRKREDFDFTRHGNLIRARTKPRTWLKLAGREFEIDIDKQTCLLVRMS